MCSKGGVTHSKGGVGKPRCVANRWTSPNLKGHCTTWAVRFAFVAAPNNPDRSQVNSLPNGNNTWTLQSFSNLHLNPFWLSRAQLARSPKRLHSFAPLLANAAQVIQTNPEKRQFASIFNEPRPSVAIPNCSKFALCDSPPYCYPSAT